MCFVQEVQRHLMNGSGWVQAKQTALLSVALEWGHDFDDGPHAVTALQIVESALLDPVLVEYLEAQYGDRTGTSLPAPEASIPVPYVSVSLQEKTYEEQNFGNWIHFYGIHNHLE